MNDNKAACRWKTVQYKPVFIFIFSRMHLEATFCTANVIVRVCAHKNRPVETANTEQLWTSY